MLADFVQTVFVRRPWILVLVLLVVIKVIFRDGFVGFWILKIRSKCVVCNVHGCECVSYLQSRDNLQYIYRTTNIYKVDILSLYWQSTLLSSQLVAVSFCGLQKSYRMFREGAFWFRKRLCPNSLPYGEFDIAVFVDQKVSSKTYFKCESCFPICLQVDSCGLSLWWWKKGKIFFLSKCGDT